MAGSIIGRLILLLPFLVSTVCAIPLIVTVSVDLKGKKGNFVPPDFVGLSHEYKSAWKLGHPKVIKLLETLETGENGGSMVIRIGGISADSFMYRPDEFGVNDTLWKHLTNLHKKTGAKFILGADFFHLKPLLTKSHMQEAKDKLPKGSIIGFEMGNEPQYYSNKAIQSGRALRPLGYATLGNPTLYTQELVKFLNVAACTGKNCKLFNMIGIAWGSNKLPFRLLKQFMAYTTKFKFDKISIHWYSLGIHGGPIEKIPSALGRARFLLAAEDINFKNSKHVAELIRIAATKKKKIIVDETNSISDCGYKGISDAYAASLWTIDFSLRLAQLGIYGVNFQQNRICHYNAFTLDFDKKKAKWQTTVYPPWMGFKVLHRAIGKGANFLPSKITGKYQKLCKAWTLKDKKTGELRVVLMNKEDGNKCIVRLKINSKTKYTRFARVVRLHAPSLLSGQDRISWQGQYYPSNLNGGAIGRHKSDKIVGRYSGNGILYFVTVQRNSAAILHIGKL